MLTLRFTPNRSAGGTALLSVVQGPEGDAATITAGTTTTGAEGTNASVSNSGSTSAAVFDFTIPRGAIPAIGFNFSTTTTDSDPGSGVVRFNNSTPASVTAIYFDNADRDGNTVTGWLDSFDDPTSTVKGTLTFTAAASPSTKLVYSVSGSVVDGTGYRKVTVTHVSGTTLPSNAAHLGVVFSRTGDKGDTGATGSTGSAATIAAGTTTTGAEGTSASVTNSGSPSTATFDFTIPRGATPAVGYTFSTTTTDSDPGNGIVRFNNATPASITEIYFDNLDTDGNTVTAWLDTFDDSTNTSHKGFLTLTDVTAPSTKIGFDVTGSSVVDGTGYRKVTVTHSFGTTLFTNARRLAVTFSRDGNKGVDGAGTGDVTAAASIADNRIVRGDGGSKGIQQTGITVDDTDNVTGIATLTLPNTGLHLLDSDASHDLIIVPGSNLSADRNLTLTTGDAARAVTISGDATISQDYSATGNPQFATIELGHASANTLSASSGILSIEGISIPRNSLSDTFTINRIELGHASDNSLTASSGVLSIEGVVIPTISSTNTLTNKRVTPRVTATAGPGATPTINTDNCDFVDLTALATAITSMTTNLSGTPTNGDKLIIRFKDNGTARAITWGASFEACGVALPTTTVISKRLTVGFIYDTTTSKWGCVASAQEA